MKHLLCCSPYQYLVSRNSRTVEETSWVRTRYVFFSEFLHTKCCWNELKVLAVRRKRSHVSLFLIWKYKGSYNSAACHSHELTTLLSFPRCVYFFQPDELTNALEISNIVFTSLFSLEMLLKVLVYGPFGYIKNPYNIFDGIIVVIRWAALTLVNATQRPGILTVIIKWEELN